MEKRFRYILWASVVVLLFASGGLSGIVFDRVVLTHVVAASSDPANSPANLQLISQALDDIKKYYVDQPTATSQTLTYGAISGMVDALGDTGHSRFLSPQMVKEEQNSTQGQFEGVGLQVNSVDGKVVIVAPIDNSPAQKAGLHAGEIIAKVDGSDLTGLSLSQVVDKILGPAGTQVTLTITDPKTNETKDYLLTRARITLQNVSWTIIPGTNIADIRIATFSQGVNQSLINALTAIQQQHVEGIVLDLRNNPGGLLDQAVDVASQFKASGYVMQEKDAQGHITPLSVHSGGLATATPVVVLVNNGSASASEIVTAALQDKHRATIVGETTFGTGTVLENFNLSDGSALLLATQEWLTPGGQSFWHKGIAPDITLKLDPTVQPLEPDQLQSMTADQVKTSPDTQLLKALSLLSQQKVSVP
jgi:carboxyl-terminal processing protease